MNNISLIKKVVRNLTQGVSDEIDLSDLGLTPCKIHNILTNELNWEELDSDMNGWEPDVWYYYTKGSKRICMYYCGFTFRIRLFVPLEED